MHSRNFLRSLPRCLLSAALVAGITTTAGVYAVDGNPPGLFELDGNTLDAGATPGDDWGSLFLGTQGGTPAAFTGILADPAPVTIYWQGGSKDINDVSEWRYKDGSVPDKDDITNAYAAGYTVQPGQATELHEAGDLIIYFGLDRYANNGDAHAAFWFFQDNVGLGPNGTFNGQHVGRNGDQRGDLMVLVEYPQGANAVPEIKVYEWDPLDADNDNVADNLDEIYSSSNAMCDGSGDKVACAITNVGNLSGEPLWPYTPKSGSGLPFESFFEGGINVSQLLGGDVPCFSSFLAETRSSRSETAQLKDFVLGAFDLCSINVTKNCVAEVDANDGGNSILVNFSGMVSNDGGLALNDVTVTDDMGTPGDTEDDVVVFGPATLAPGESQPYNGSYSTMDLAPTDRVTAEGHRVNTTVTAEAEASCAPDLTPAIAVDKFCSASINGGGDAIDVLFNGTVTNSGNVALENVTVVDDNGTPGNLADDVTINIGNLDAGASAPYNGSFSVSGSNTSTDHVVATGTAVLGGDAVQDTAQATCLADVLPDIAVDKVCSASINGSGTGIDVLFNGSVTNTGNVLLNNVTVVDDNGTPGNPADDVTVLGPISLAPGASAPYSGGFGALGTNSSTDVVVASGIDAITSSPVQDTANASCLADVLPNIAVDKFCSASINGGGTGIDVLFNGTVSNTGNVALLGVTVVDDNGTPGNPGDDVTVLGPIDLAPGASAPYSGGFGVLGANSSTDVVIASGTDAVTGSPVQDTANASCLADVSPDLLVTKQCTDAPAFGQAILFDGSVTNNGNVALLGVIIVDDNATPADPSDDVTFNIGDLAPGASANYNGSYSPALAGTYTNTVVASATDAVTSGPVESAPAQATCDVPPPQEFEGCTPGFWKNSPGSWPPTGYSPNQLIISVFDLPSGVINNKLGGDSLMDALNYGGGDNLLGSAQILLRAAVAALLDSAHPEVDYPRTTADVIADVNAALATKDRGSILALASALDADNNLGCDLANDNSF
ncbi:DUF7507 domain-containing protein [Pseudomonas sp. EA_105y_Pfl2_R69]|uniref:DUF7507 domain-containing protein n=1 Tax=Pseudomonas sp. EA_105y_Pfl2_R69 TaxID=3088683 RepID=UPI0030DD2AB8